jgi:hypothetical protein
MLGQELESDMTFKLFVHGQIHVTHATSTDLLGDSVVTDFRSAGQGNKGPGLVVVRIRAVIVCHRDNSCRLLHHVALLVLGTKYFKNDLTAIGKWPGTTGLSRTQKLK